MIKDPYIGMPIIIGNTNASSQNMSFDKMLLGSLPLAMSYVPFQQWNTTYEKDKALQIGTIFPDLDFPFEGGGMR